MKKSIYSLILFIVICCVSCSRTIMIKTVKIQTLKVGSPLSGVKPLSFHVKTFSDTRNVEKTFVGKYVHKYYTDIPVGEVIQNEIIKELKRNKHLYQEKFNINDSILIITGSVFKYWLTFEIGTFSCKVTGNVGVKTNVYFSNKPDVIFSKKYEGSYSSSGLAISNNTAIKILNTALQNMIRDFSTDDEFIHFICKKN